MMGCRVRRSYFCASSQGRQKDGRQKIFCGVEGWGSVTGNERRRPSAPFDVFDFCSVTFFKSSDPGRPLLLCSGRTPRIRRRRAQDVADTTDSLRAVACIRFVRPNFSVWEVL